VIRGEIWWVDLGIPHGSEPGFRRPVLIVQNDAFTRSNLSTVIVVPISSNLALAEAPGNVFLSRKQSGLPRDSVINISQLTVLDKSRFEEKVRKLKPEFLRSVETGLRIVLDIN
tara:strand:+ start:341 stop:682 length:342 start_codon:yes stop_codon:yes gene_type:complete